MAEITTAMVKELREATGAGILETRNALKEAEGDFDRAVQLLRERGLAKAAKKADRTANQGIIMSELEHHGHVGAMLELNCETDFVARNDQFQSLASSLVKLAVESGADSADALLDKSLEGRTVKSLLTDSVATIGENIQLRRVARFEAAEHGFITSYIHMGGRIGVLLEISGANEDLAHDIALQIAAASPRFVHSDEVPADVTEAERSIYRTQMAEDKKPDHIKERIVQGKVDKFLDEIVLLRQPFIKDPNKTIQQLLKETGGAVTVRRFARFELGA
ncbi:MAG: elongation factor Ts [Anaerolineae bacterium]|nr:elongation factor Ts [Anaerolineae bacterium]